MKQISAILILFLMAALPHGWAQSPMFTTVSLAQGPGFEESLAMISDPSGRLYVTGRYDSACSFGNHTLPWAANDNMFLACYDPSAGWLWAASPLSAQRAQGEAVARDSQGSVYVTGSFYNTVTFAPGLTLTNDYVNCYIAKYDSEGNLLWAKQVEGDENSPRSIACDSDGNVFLAGTFTGNLQYGIASLHASRNAGFFLKLTGDGSLGWLRSSTGSGFAVADAITVAPDGNITATGLFNNEVSFGTFPLTGSGSSEIFVCRMSPAGDFLWAIQAGGTGSDWGRAVVCGSGGNVFISGYYENIATFGPFTLNTGNGISSSSAFVAKIDGSGTFKWATSLPVASPGNNLMTIDGDENLFLTGSFWGAEEVGPSVLWSHGYGDVYVIKVDRNGTPLWAKGAGCDYVDYGSGIALLPSGDLAVTGVIYADAVFDSIAMAPGTGGLFVATLSQRGPLVIDEVNYHSSDTLDAGDWVELRNAGTKRISLAGWALKDGNDSNTFVFDSAAALAPGAFLVICQDTARFRNIYPWVDNATGPFGYDLAPNGEKIRLFDNHGLLITQVRYYSVAPWPDSVNGTGRTMELRDCSAEPSVGTNWFNGCPGGSPGRRFIACDSIGYATPEWTETPFILYPNPVGDRLYISWGGEKLRHPYLRIFDRSGRAVMEIDPSEAALISNGMEISVGGLPPGLYLVLLQSDTALYRGTFILSGSTE